MMSLVFYIGVVSLVCQAGAVDELTSSSTVTSDITTHSVSEVDDTSTVGSPFEVPLPVKASNISRFLSNVANDVVNASALQTAAQAETTTEAVNDTQKESEEIANKTAVFLPEEGAAEREHFNSLTLFFLLLIVLICIFLIHGLLLVKCHYLPDSLAIIFVGAVIAIIIKVWSPEIQVTAIESFSPTMFFLVLLPPIIFESGYNLHKGDFFANIASILIFAVFGTFISTLVVSFGIFTLGQIGLIFSLNFVQSFAFGALISAVDPVATITIFQALKVDPVLNMLVFGESILNDAVAIVLTTTVVSFTGSDAPAGQQLLQAALQFIYTFFGSAAIGVIVGLSSALVLKHVDFYRHPSLEFGVMVCFAYIPYALSEGIHLSGIMSILFCGIVMSHYTHFNLSPVTQITMQQSMRTLSFVCESCVFAYLGLALFSFPLDVEVPLVVAAIFFILLGRALNIYPLSIICNRFRMHRITKPMMFIMWYSGLRGAIAYALSLHLEFDEDIRRVIVTTTLIVVLFTTVVLGGTTMPLLKLMSKCIKFSPDSPTGQHSTLHNERDDGTEDGNVHAIPATVANQRGPVLTDANSSLFGPSLSSTSSSSQSSDATVDEMRRGSCRTGVRSCWDRLRNTRDFHYYDVHYFQPFFVRKFTLEEMSEGRDHVANLTEQWIHGLQNASTHNFSSRLPVTDGGSVRQNVPAGDSTRRVFDGASFTPLRDRDQ